MHHSGTSMEGNTMFGLLPIDVTRKIFRLLHGQDLCNAAGTCKEFWKYVSAVETLETVLNGESQAFSLDRFLLAHTKDGLQVAPSTAQHCF